MPDFSKAKLSSADTIALIALILAFVTSIMSILVGIMTYRLMIKRRGKILINQSTWQPFRLYSKEVLTFFYYTEYPSSALQHHVEDEMFIMSLAKRTAYSYRRGAQYQISD
jgi:hypothetical protein